MKKIKCFVSILLILSFAFSSNILVNADSNEIVKEITINENYYLSPVSYPNDIEAVFASAWDSYKTDVDVSKYKIQEKDIGNIYSEISNLYPEYFYIDKTISFTIGPRNYINEITFNYLHSANVLNTQREKLNNAVDSILSKMKGIFSDEDKIVFFHDYISSYNVYDPDGLSGDVNLVDDYSFTAYGALVNNIAVCQGISDAFILLCKRVGIDASIVSSDPMVHAWNMVKINNNYYHLDITWDDSYCSGFSDVKGFSSHKHFIKSDNQMLNLEHYGWNDVYTAYDNRTFNNYYWNNVNSNIYYIKGFQYYIKDSKLIKRNPSTKKETVLYTIEESSFNINSNKYIWESSNALLSYNYKDYFLFINLSDGIYAYDLVNASISKVLNHNGNGYIAGLNVEANKIYYDIANFNSNGTESYISTKEAEITIPTQELVYGDVNNSGEFDIADLLAIKQHLVNYDNDFNQFNADVNEDYRIDLKDVLLMAKKLANN